MAGARIIGGDRLNKKLGAFARGLDITADMELAAEVTRTDYIDRIQDIQGSREQTRYGPKRKVTVSDAGQAPNNDTGALIAGTGVAAIRKNAVEVFSSAAYADMLEFGTRKMKPRPALGPAYKATEKKVITKIAQAITRKMKGLMNG